MNESKGCSGDGPGQEGRSSVVLAVARVHEDGLRERRQEQAFRVGRGKGAGGRRGAAGAARLADGRGAGHRDGGLSGTEHGLLPAVKLLLDRFLAGWVRVEHVLGIGLVCVRPVL